MADEPVCVNCGGGGVRSRRRCGPCATWLQRHGYDRPEHVQLAYGRRWMERKIEQTCA